MYDAHEHLTSRALAQALANLRARKPSPLTVAQMIAAADKKRGFFARIFSL